MRLMQRTKVLLPHPDGPMMASTVFCGTASVTPRNAWVSLNQALRSCTSIFIEMIRSGCG